MYSFDLADQIIQDSKAEDLRSLLDAVPQVGHAKQDLAEVASFLDLTTLEGTDNTESVKRLCQKALDMKGHGLPLPAAVCVYPPFIATARACLAGSDLKIAVTAAGFPSGQLPIGLKQAEVAYAVKAGADEIDIVISRGTFLANDYETVYRELIALREAASDRILKVILETGELGTAMNIARAAEIAIMAGADFIKTSTGKISPAATPEAMFIMSKILRLHFETSGRRVGIKPAGGISEPAAALEYYTIVKSVLGTDWLSPALFRIGASRLADKLITLY